MKEKFFPFSSDEERKKLEQALLVCGYTKEEAGFFFDFRLLEAIVRLYLRKDQQAFSPWFNFHASRMPRIILDKTPFAGFSERELTDIESVLARLQVDSRELDILSDEKFLKICLQALRLGDAAPFSRLVLDHWGADNHWLPETEFLKDVHFRFSSVDCSLEFFNETATWQSALHLPSGHLVIDKNLEDLLEIVPLPESLKKWGDNTPEKKLKNAFPESRVPNINFAYHLLKHKELIPPAWRGESFFFLGSTFISRPLEVFRQTTDGNKHPGAFHRPLALCFDYRDKWKTKSTFIPSLGGFTHDSWPEQEYDQNCWSPLWEMLYYDGIYQTKTKVLLFK